MGTRETGAAVAKIALAMLFWLTTPACYGTEDLVETFRAKTQALFDAFIAGDSALWNRTLDDDCIITTENGELLNKGKMLEAVRTARPGFTAQIRVRGLTVKRVGDAAVVHYWLDEVGAIYGQEFHTTYLQTDTYQRAGREWKAIAQQETVVPRDLDAIAADSADWKLLFGGCGLTRPTGSPRYQQHSSDQRSRRPASCGSNPGYQKR